jgi:aquaporin Z
MTRALRQHWPEYLIEAAALGLFMISAGLFGTLLEAPGSPLRELLPDPFLRRALMGLAMGLTAVGIIYSPWGQRSGAHMNPAVTLTFLRLGKIEPWDAAHYVVAQSLGGVAGLLLIGTVLGPALREPPVLSVATLPGPQGEGVAFGAELAVSFLLMVVVLAVSNSSRFPRFTGLCAGALVALFITFEAPYSGMSINPARSLASAWPSGVWTAFWVYLTAPAAGMLLAAEAYRLGRGPHAVRCAKLNHGGPARCIFRCGYCQPGAPGP